MLGWVTILFWPKVQYHLNKSCILDFCIMRKCGLFPPSPSFLPWQFPENSLVPVFWDSLPQSHWSDNTPLPFPVVGRSWTTGQWKRITPMLLQVCRKRWLLIGDINNLRLTSAYFKYIQADIWRCRQNNKYRRLLIGDVKQPQVEDCFLEIFLLIGDVNNLKLRTNFWKYIQVDMWRCR